MWLERYEKQHPEAKNKLIAAVEDNRLKLKEAVDLAENVGMEGELLQDLLKLVFANSKLHSVMSRLPRVSRWKRRQITMRQKKNVSSAKRKLASRNMSLKFPQFAFSR